MRCHDGWRPYIGDSLIMQAEQGPLQAILLKLFESTPNPQDLMTTVLTEPLVVTVVEKLNRHYLYVTDSVHTIMAVFAGKREEVVRFPLQAPHNNFYTFGEKTHMYLNFDSEDIELAQNPYNPRFMMGDRFGDFVEHCKNFRCDSSQVFELKEWRVGLVNVNKSGYYAPVIVIEKHQFKRQAKADPRHLRCILYEKWLQTSMERYRIQDMRRTHPCCPPLANHHSLCYYLCKHPLTCENIKATTMLSVDKTGGKVNHDENLQVSYVSLGNITGPCGLLNKVESKIDQQKLDQVELERLSVLFNNRVTLREEKRKGEGLLWSDDESEEGEDGDSAQEGGEGGPREGESESSDEGDDPLRRLYRQQIEARNNQQEFM